MQLQNEEVQNNHEETNTDLDNIEINIQIGSDEESEDRSLIDDEKSSRFKDGEIIQMIRVRFPGNAKSFPFFIGKRRFNYGQKVVAMSDRGMTVGYINSFPYDVEFNKSMLPIRSIAKVASEDDIKAQKDFRESEKKAEIICLHLIEKHKLDMVLTHVEFIQFGKKAVFYFNAPERVDFRELVKDLVADLKMRIELRQISVRDRAAALGAIGACGLQTCCSSFLKSYGNVSIKMAKNQNLALIPSKLNGVCGQIKCCIKYEDDVYADKRKNLPKEGTIVKVKNGDIGKVLKLHLLVEQFELLTDFGAKRRYFVSQYDENIQLADTYKFPETFDHIVDETKEVIGLNLEEKLKADRFIESLPDEDELEELEDFENDDSDDQDPDDVNPYDNDNEEIEVIVKEVKSTAEENKQITRDNQQRPQHQNRDNRNQQQTRDNRNRPQHQNNQNNQNNNQRRDNRPNNNQQRDNRPDNRNGENRNQENRQQNRPHHNRNQDNRNGNQNENRQHNNQGERRPHNNRPNNNQQGQGQSQQGQGPGQNRNNKNFKPRNHHNNQNRDNRNPNQQGQQAQNPQNNQRPNDRDKDKDQQNKKTE